MCQVFLGEIKAYGAAQHFDDAYVAASISSGRFEGTIRRTRNSQRSKLELQRWLPLNEDERDIIRRTALELDLRMPEVEPAPSA